MYSICDRHGHRIRLLVWLIFYLKLYLLASFFFAGFGLGFLRRFRIRLGRRSLLWLSGFSHHLWNQMAVSIYQFGISHSVMFQASVHLLSTPQAPYRLMPRVLQMLYKNLLVTIQLITLLAKVESHSTVIRFVDAYPCLLFVLYLFAH